MSFSCKTGMENSDSKTTTESTISKTWELSASVTRMASTDFYNAIENVLTEMSWCLTGMWRLNAKIHIHINTKDIFEHYYPTNGNILDTTC